MPHDLRRLKNSEKVTTKHLLNIYQTVILRCRKRPYLKTDI